MKNSAVSGGVRPSEASRFAHNLGRMLHRGRRLGRHRGIRGRAGLGRGSTRGCRTRAWPDRSGRSAGQTWAAWRARAGRATRTTRVGVPCARATERCRGSAWAGRTKGRCRAARHHRGQRGTGRARAARLAGAEGRSGADRRGRGRGATGAGRSARRYRLSAGVRVRGVPAERTGWPGDDVRVSNAMRRVSEIRGADSDSCGARVTRVRLPDAVVPTSLRR